MFQETIKRFNQVPMKNFIAFLNMLGAGVMPAEPAQSYVTFSLSTGAGTPVSIPVGTRVSAMGSSGEEVIFETEKNILLTPAVLSDGYQISTREDCINKLPAPVFASLEDSAAFDLFKFSAADNLQEHCLYLGHKNLFNLTGTVAVSLRITHSQKRFKEHLVCQRLADPQHLEWQFWTGDGWQSFNQVRSEGNTLLLKKTVVCPWTENEIEGISNRWMRCRVRDKQVSQVEDLEFESIAMKTDFLDVNQTGGIVPDGMYCNDIQLNPAGDYPFGEFFNLYDCFYLSSQEAFSKASADISFSFDLKMVPNVMSEEKRNIDWKLIMKASQVDEQEAPRIFVARVAWEYWNGSGWVKLTSEISLITGYG
jgi:hypothetical protein